MVQEVLEESLVLKPREAFELLRVSRNTGYELIRTGALRNVRVGRSFLIPRSALIEFLSGERADG
jgi:excisionase family DNA binding protein